MYIKLLTIIVLVVCLISVSAYAFDDQKTHRELTKAAIAPTNSKFDNYLVKFVGYSSGVKQVLSGVDRKGYNKKYGVEVWLQEGSTDEDHPLCRATNHFHNPIHSGDWTQSKMSDSVLVPFYSFIVNCGTKYSNVTWATGFTAPIAGYTVRDGQVMGWDNARTYFFDALTSSDPIVREEKIVNTFKSVGMVVHLLQDMAVPAHVRNDMQSHLLNSLTNPSKWGSNPFEKYVSTHPSAISIDPNPFKPTFALPLKLTDFWDNNSYTGENPSAGTDQGLAEYANANFVSDFTIFKPQSDTKHYFKYPSETTSVSKAHYTIADPINPGQTIKRTYYQKIKDGDVGYRLAGVGFLNRWSVSLAAIKRIPPMDDNVHDDYANKILPRAVGYSASLLDYFFRGRIELSFPQPQNESFRFIRLKARNVGINSDGTPASEEMTNPEEIKLVVRHKRSLMNPSQGTVVPEPIPQGEDGYHYLVVPLKNTITTIPRNTTVDLEFDLSDTPIPMWSYDITLQVVYKGQLGNENGAVAVGSITLPKINSDILLTLPDSGVFGTSSVGVSPVFNEIRVNATNIANGTDAMSNGTIELFVQYKLASEDPFKNNMVISSPDIGTYYIRVPEINGATGIPRDATTELVFNLASKPLPIWATDVYIYVVYTGQIGAKTNQVAIGFRDISEPTPVDVYNNTDYTCLNSTWYKYDETAAMNIVDSNSDGKADRSDIYPHTISDIAFLSGPVNTTLVASPQENTLFAAGPLLPGQKLRLGYILTDYTNNFTFHETRARQTANDEFDHISLDTNITGRGFRNDGDTQDRMYTFRNADTKLWSGQGVIFINKEYNGTCTFDALNQKLGL